jgi:hypothetical protein
LRLSSIFRRFFLASVTWVRRSKVGRHNKRSELIAINLGASCRPSSCF